MLFLNKTYSRDQIKGLLEAILFVYGKPVDINKLVLWLNITIQELEALIHEMNIDFVERNSGFTIIAVADGYQLMTNPVFKDEMRELFGSKEENKLSQTSMEILAIIAYRQPISKEQIDKIRGVNSSRTLNTLLGHKLIDIVENDKILGEPMYGTTKRFLEIFRLQNLNELPAPENIDFELLSVSSDNDLFQE